MIDIILSIITLYLLRVLYKKNEQEIQSLVNRLDRNEQEIQSLVVGLEQEIQSLRSVVTMLKKKNDRSIIAVDADAVEQVQAIVEDHRKYGGNKTIEQFYSDMEVKSKYFEEYMEHNFKTIASYRIYDEYRQMIEQQIRGDNSGEDRQACIEALMKLKEGNFDEEEFYRNVKNNINPYSADFLRQKKVEYGSVPLCLNSHIRQVPVFHQIKA